MEVLERGREGGNEKEERKDKRKIGRENSLKLEGIHVHELRL